MIGIYKKKTTDSGGLSMKNTNKIIYCFLELTLKDYLKIQLPDGIKAILSKYDNYT